MGSANTGHTAQQVLPFEAAPLWMTAVVWSPPASCVNMCFGMNSQPEKRRQFDGSGTASLLSSLNHGYRPPRITYFRTGCGGETPCHVSVTSLPYVWLPLVSGKRASG